MRFVRSTQIISSSKSNNDPHQTWLSRTASFVGSSMVCSALSSMISTVRSGNGLASATTVFASSKNAKGSPPEVASPRNHRPPLGGTKHWMVSARTKSRASPVGEKSFTIFSGGICTQEFLSHAYQVSSG